jgi:hypothetical protein
MVDVFEPMFLNHFSSGLYLLLLPTDPQPWNNNQCLISHSLMIICIDELTLISSLKKGCTRKLTVSNLGTETSNKRIIDAENFWPFYIIQNYHFSQESFKFRLIMNIKIIQKKIY